MLKKTINTMSHLWRNLRKPKKKILQNETPVMFFENITGIKKLDNINTTKPKKTI